MGESSSQLYHSAIQRESTQSDDLDRFLGHFARTGCISKIRGDEIRFTLGGTNFVHRLLPALQAAPHNHDMDPQADPVYWSWREPILLASPVMSVVEVLLVICKSP